jgi:phosphoribosylformylglycinamidine synthase
MYTANVRVMLKKSVLDPQGVTVKGSLKSLQFDTVTDVRVGKFVQISFDVSSEAEARALADEACKKLLSNPVIEDYTFDVIPGGVKS